MNLPESTYTAYREQLRPLDQVPPVGWNPDSAWERLETQLPAPQKRKLPIFWISAAAACLILLWMFSLGQPQEVNSVPTDTPPQALTETPVAPTNEHPTDDVPKTEMVQKGSPSPLKPNKYASSNVSSALNRGTLRPLSPIGIEDQPLSVSLMVPKTIALQPVPEVKLASRLPVVRFQSEQPSSLSLQSPDAPIRLNVVPLRPISAFPGSHKHIAIKIPFSSDQP